MGTNFFTNEKENTLLEKIEGVFKYKKVHFFDALVGYFRASGYFRIRKFIQQTPHIRILVGINVDKLTYQANQQGLLFNPNSEQSQEEFFNDIKKNIQEAKQYLRQGSGRRNVSVYRRYCFRQNRNAYSSQTKHTCQDLYLS